MTKRYYRGVRISRAPQRVARAMERTMIFPDFWLLSRSEQFHRVFEAIRPVLIDELISKPLHRVVAEILKGHKP